MLPALFQAAIFVFVIAAISMPAGVGGGLLYVPLLLLLHVVKSGNDAAALSQPIIAGASLAGTIFNLMDQRQKGRQHRQSSKGAEAGQSPNLIDPRIIAALLTPCLAGVSVGAILNQMLPEFVIMIMLLLVISWSLTSTMQKAMEMWKQESEAKASAAAEAPTEGLSSIRGGEVLAAIKASEIKALFVQEKDMETAICADDSGGSGDYGASSASTGLTDCDGDGAVKEAGESSTAVDWIKLLNVWAFVLVITALRGSKHGPSLVTMCSWEYWTISAVGFLVLLGVSFLLRHPKLGIFEMVACGCLSAIAGKGGGVVLNPMMLRAGFDAPTASANVSVVILMNSATATFTFLMAGAIEPMHMAVLSAVSFCGSLSGKSILGWAIARTGRTSLLVFLLTAILVLSCCMIMSEGSVRLQKAIEHPEFRKEFFNLHRFCPE